MVYRLSGAGKSTLAVELERQLFQKGYQVYVLNGDNVRNGLNSNLGFSPDDRAGEISDFTGISAPYEPPDAGEIEIDTGKLDLAESMEKLVEYVERNFPYSAGN